jgi:hypothetical protein
MTARILEKPTRLQFVGEADGFPRDDNIVPYSSATVLFCQRLAQLCLRRIHLTLRLLAK